MGVASEGTWGGALGAFHSGSHPQVAPGRRRLGAAAIDLGLAYMLHVPLAAYLMFAGYEGRITWPQLLVLLGLEIALVMASGVPEILGASIGKRLLRLGIRSEAGDALRPGKRILRWLMKFLPIAGVLAAFSVPEGPHWRGEHLPVLMFGLTLSSALFVIAIIDVAFVFRSNRRALHDVLTGSVVVDVREMGAISVSVERAALGTRMKAGGVDLFFWWVMNTAAVIIGTSSGASTSTMYKIILSIPIVYSMADIWSATPGKVIFKLRILGQDGSPAPRSRMLLRWLVKYALFLAGPVASMLLMASGQRDDPAILVPAVIAIGLVEMLCVVSLHAARGPRRQTFWDMVSRTAVYPRPAPTR